jgi:hypothetical protein
MLVPNWLILYTEDGITMHLRSVSTLPLDYSISTANITLLMFVASSDSHWKADSYSPNRGIRCLLWNPKVHYCNATGPCPEPVWNPFHIHTFCAKTPLVLPSRLQLGIPRGLLYRVEQFVRIFFLAMWHTLSWCTVQRRTQGGRGGAAGLQPPKSPKPKFKIWDFVDMISKVLRDFPLQPKWTTEVSWLLIHYNFEK